MAGPSICPKCAGAMEPGFTLDQGHGSYAVAEWVEGEPERSIWTGIKLGKKTRFKVQTWRCRRCGYLESYAPEAE
ncbi:MAG TPA: PF20097 family protein [Allosphingosinicella sp.]|nr:PF20097 family protein [Allosphingosinicella sp.]